jgi:glycosyltransferase involved in cell wall biosynthesis
MEGPLLTVVIPAFCEAATIGEVIIDIKGVAPVIVVDDGSTDDTAKVAEAAGAIVVQCSTNQGYENALQVGFEAAEKLGYEIVITLDADGEHGPNYVPIFQDLLIRQNVPLVIGIRRRTQRTAESVVGEICKRMFGANDILCGMKGYHLDLWRANGGFDHSRSAGMEITLNALSQGIKFEQVAVDGRMRRDSPRFGVSVATNLRILAGFLRALHYIRRHPMSLNTLTRLENIAPRNAR